MSPAKTLDLSTQASKLVGRLFSGQNDQVGFMSCAVYDTAWVSMITKDSPEGPQWLFPECFKYLLQTQKEGQGWETAEPGIDGILNTAAALLALVAHSKQRLQLTSPSDEELNRRIKSAIISLKVQLQLWDVESADRVGFEILVPSILRLLECENLTFDFPGRPALMKLNQIKLSKLKPEYLYAKQKSTALHSLEAFVGMIDFDKVSHHKQSGAFMASPSSTAAYLMYSSSWDDEAEEYLHDVIRSGAGQGSGGVPSAFPSTYFEMTWVLTTLLENSFTISDIGEEQAQRAATFLKSAVEEQGGLLGFACNLEADADDTAKALLALSILGHHTSPAGLLKEFECETHFRTYRGERNASFSANCNVLLALLSQPDPSVYTSQIEKATKFLCNTWWESDTFIEDKWSISTYYPYMLLTEALSKLLAVWDSGNLPSFPETLIRDQVLISIYQALIRTLQKQNSDGSWGPRGSREETAYAVLTILNACCLPHLETLFPVIDTSIDIGRQFLELHSGEGPDSLWIEKVTYGSAVLCESYVLAALKAHHKREQVLASISSLVDVPEKSVKKYVAFYTSLPLFSSVAPWKIRAALIEAYLFLPQLRQIRLDVFPRTQMEEDKYFEYIPFTWTGNSNHNNTFLPTKTLRDMMILSFLNYQADEYMEAVVGRYFGMENSALVSIIDGIFSDIEVNLKGAANTEEACGPALKKMKLTKSHPASNGSFPTKHANGSNNGVQTRKESRDVPSLQDVSDVLRSFISYIMHHPCVNEATPLDRSRVKTELRTFLLSHMEQSEDNMQFSKQLDCQGGKSDMTFQQPRTSFYNWVHTTSANHTSCPYSFAFYQCLLAAEQRNRPSASLGIQQRYISEAMCRHLATLCRMYNDYGSVARDRDERNLNSVNFPEFAPSSPSDGGSDDDSLRKELLLLAEYEREQMETALGKLRNLAAKDKAQQRALQKVQMFCDVTDLYGQIYVARDIASRM
ncbi:ent-kaurene synthase [Arthroderma uncinatum]|uniref:ent-kaurene synthase n=1 Tax=Arthroderma uncinatum TaxID=74035 RepID=UPI00144AC375|nr:ent-kaurene synthase [Arthroderma uncinatum]KAF3480656.1 ent-kaurene synthase [Arthroderma uncinatum]